MNDDDDYLLSVEHTTAAEEIYYYYYFSVLFASDDKTCELVTECVYGAGVRYALYFVFAARLMMIWCAHNLCWIDWAFVVVGRPKRRRQRQQRKSHSTLSSSSLPYFRASQVGQQPPATCRVLFGHFNDNSKSTKSINWDGWVCVCVRSSMALG